jgi:hypothetical protein
VNPRDLLELAVPAPPPDAQIAPVTQIRARVRRRRRIRITLFSASVAAAMVVAVGVGVPLVGRASPASPGTLVQWQYVRVDRAGLMLTVFAGACLETARALASSRNERQAIVVTVHAVVSPDGCTAPGASDSVSLWLESALGDRSVIDGADGQVRTSFLDRELPLAPAGYSEQSFATVGASAADPISKVGWTKPGGPDLIVTARKRSTVVPIAGPSYGAVQVGKRTGAVYQAGAEMVVQWDVGDLVYALDAQPTGGTTINLPQFRALVASLRWDQ